MKHLLLFAAAIALSGCVVTIVDDSGPGANAGTGAGAVGGSPATGGASSMGGTPSTGGGGAGTGGSGGTGGSSGCEAPPSPQAFEVGTGESCFARLAPLDVVPMMSGPQGGYHVWFAFGCTTCGADAHVKWGVKDPQTGVIIAQTYDSEAVLPLSPGPFPQFAGIQHGMPGGFFNDPPDPLPPGTHVVMWGDLVDDQGMVLVHDEVEVVIGDVMPWDPCANDPNCNG